MTVHIRKLCVGVDTVEDLERWQAGRARANEKAGLGAIVWHTTRSFPRRADEILAGGGSLYWIVRGVMCVRQPILRFDPVTDAQGRPACNIVLAPGPIPVEPRAHRPFQGWRYLKGEEAPRDLAQAAGGHDLPPGLAAELRAIGAW